MKSLSLIVLVFMLQSGLCQQEDYEENDYIRTIEKATNLAYQPKTKDKPKLVIADSFLAKHGQGNLQDRAGTLLESGLYLAAEEVSQPCRNQTDLFIDALQSQAQWALEMFDAGGKPMSGIFQGELRWLGSWEECLGVVASDYINQNGTLVEIPESFVAQYCTAQVRVTTPISGRLQIGMCFPESCTVDDTRQLATTFLSLIPLEGIGKVTTTCRANTLEFSDKAIVVTIICGIFAFIIVVATLYDLIIKLVIPKLMQSSYKTLFEEPFYGSIKFDLAKPPPATSAPPPYDTEETKLIKSETEKVKVESEISRPELENKSNYLSYKPGLFGQALLSFSVYSNAPKILSTDQPAGTLTAVNGIRFISMTWVILGHTYAFGNNITDNTLSFTMEMYNRWTFQAIANATVSVDTFFVLSGLLVAYLGLKEMQKKGGPKKTNWFMFYFHRFWRLTPPYMLLLMLYVPTYKYWSDGPLWPQTGRERDECEDTWWTNLLYLNNVVKSDKMCMGWSWYLANDMQFYWISPFMLISLYYSKILGSILCFCLILANFISAALISKDHDFVLGGNSKNSFDLIYVKPWCRVGPYVVGILLGYVLYRTKCRVKMNKFVNILGWLIATTVALLVLYGLYNDNPEPKFTVDTSALYTATHRTAWGLAVAWVIFACATGYGGPVNALLSWRALIPLSRLTYCAYLIHPLVQYTYYNSRRTLMTWYDIEVVCLFLSQLCLAYAGAFVLSLAFESPMMALEKVLLRRPKKS